MKQIVWLTALVMVCLLGAARGQDINLTGYTMTFDDEFNTLSATTTSPKGSSTWYAQPLNSAGYYSASTWDITSLSINGGILADTAFLDGANNWHSGELLSVDPTGAGFSQTYGYFEIRCMMPDSGTGAWPAFWLDTTSGISGGANEEVDIFEWYGVCDTAGSYQDLVQQTSHNWNPDGSQNTTTAPYLPSTSTAIPNGTYPWQGYHIYGCQIDPVHMTWYIDGVQTNQCATPTTYLATPFYVQLDYALGGGWPLSGMVNDSSLKVDWVRVYSLPATAPTKSIGVQFVGGGTALATTDNAGVTAVAQSNWKALTGASFSGVALNDNSGAATTATLSGGADGSYFSGSAFASGTGNAKLCSGELVDGNITTETNSLTVASIPYAQYDVYIYGACDAGGRNATFTLTPSGGAASSLSFQTESNGSTWTAGTNTWNGSGTAPSLSAGNYVHFTGLTASSFNLKFGGVGNVGLNGIQIVNTATGTTPPAITSGTTASGTVGSAFTYQITASNTPTSYSATGLPAGLSVNTSTGAITGTPSAAGTSTVTIGATNAGGTGTATLTLTVSASGLTFSTPASVTAGSVGLNDSVYHGVGEPPLTGYSAPTDSNITAVDTYAAGHTPAYVFLNATTGFNYTGGSTVSAYLGTDAAGAAASDTTANNGVIYDSIGYINIPAASVNKPFTFAITAADDAGRVLIGGNGTPGTGTIVAEQNFQGSGLSVAASQTVTFTQAGLYPIEVLTYQDVGGSGFHFTVSGASYTYNIAGTAAAPVITSATTASGTVGTAFSYQITASNTPTSYNATGLPSGLTVSTSTGAISGTPTAAGTSSVTISATNAGGTGSATLVLTVSAAGAQQSIGLQFVGQGTAIAATASAGVPAVAQTNWQALTGSTFSGIALTNNTGAATTASITGSADGGYFAGSSFPAGGNQTLCTGELFDGAITTETHSITISSVPYAQYDVYVYGACDAGGRNATFTLTPSGGSASSLSFQTENNSSTWTAGTNTWNGSGTAPTLAVGNYVHFTGITTNTFTLKFGGAGNVGMNAIQIVKTGP